MIIREAKMGVIAHRKHPSKTKMSEKVQNKQKRLDVDRTFMNIQEGLLTREKKTR